MFVQCSRPPCGRRSQGFGSAIEEFIEFFEAVVAIGPREFVLKLAKFASLMFLVYVSNHLQWYALFTAADIVLKGIWPWRVKIPMTVLVYLSGAWVDVPRIH